MEKNEQNGAQPEVGAKDAFGQPLVKEELKPEVPGEKKEEKPVETDPLKHPSVVAALKERDDKIEKQSNDLSGQGKALREVNKRLKALEAGKPAAGDQNVDLPHKEIKRSKDLTSAERDEMTQREIQQMDEIAAMKDRENKAALEAHDAKKKADAAAAGDDDDEDEDEDEEEKKREKAKEPAAFRDAAIEKLSGGDAERKRELKEAAKLISFEGLKTAEEIEARVKLAAEKFIPKWTPPKEQASPAGNGGKPVEGGGAVADDPHDVMKFIKGNKSEARGQFAL